MSYNNHDKDDPNAVKYARAAKLATIPDGEEDFELMQVYLMATSMTYVEFRNWITGKYILTPPAI